MEVTEGTTWLDSELMPAIYTRHIVWFAPSRRQHFKYGGAESVATWPSRRLVRSTCVSTTLLGESGDLIS